MKRVTRLLYPKTAHGIWAPVLATIALVICTTMVLAARHLNPIPTPGQTDAKTDSFWQKWLNEDVVYIISEEERATFEQQKTDTERQTFVQQFWARRDPTPGTPENEFKEEHYRRLAKANQKFAYAAGHILGCKTDRGRIYILYGPPDEIDSHLSGGYYERPASEGGGSVNTYPFEDWGYRQFQRIGSLNIEFVDTKMSGELHMTLDPNEKYKKP